MLRALLKTPIISAPIIVPLILPFPPVSFVPPSTTAAIASSSYPVPAVGWAEYNLEVIIIPAIADNIPLIVYTHIFILSVLSPDNLVASSFPPNAYVW